MLSEKAIKLNSSRIRSQRGITLLEVLVTIVILSFGLLGVAGLQAGSLKANQSSYYRSIANSLAPDIVDKLRANALLQPLANQSTTAGYYLMTAGSTAANCSTSTCTPEELANYEVAGWRSSIASLLPNGQGIVCLDSTPYDGTGDGSEVAPIPKTDPACDGNATTGKWVVKIWWNDSRAKTAVGDTTPATPQRLVVIFQP